MSAGSPKDEWMARALAAEAEVERLREALRLNVALTGMYVTTPLELPSLVARKEHP